MSVLVHVGNAVVDVVLRVEALPSPGGDAFAEPVGEFAGGGFNVMAAASRQGMRVVYGGAHGVGPRGDLVRAAMRAEGVGLLQEPGASCDTGYSLALVTPDGERTFVSVAGAEALLTGAALEQVRPGPDDVVYLTGYSLMHPVNTEALAAWLPGVPESVVVVFDPGPLVAKAPARAVESFLTRADWVTVNRDEARVLTGEDDPALAARVLSEGRGAIVRTGADGCVVATCGGEPVLVAAPVVDAVDLNGAGDAHTGAFIAALARGLAPVEAAAWANRAAAWSVTRVGPATCPTLAEMGVRGG